MQPLIRPSKWYYLIGAGLLAVGALASVRFHATRMTSVAAGLTRIVVPGEGNVSFSSGGHGTIFLEHRSVVGSRVFLTPEDPGDLQVTLRDAGGADVPLTLAWIPFSYAGELRAGRAVYDFWIAGPGAYRLAARYPPGSAGSSVVLAVGHGLLGDLSGPILGGLAASGGTILAGLAALGTVWRMRQRYRRRIYGRFH